MEQPPTLVGRGLLELPVNQTGGVIGKETPTPPLLVRVAGAGWYVVVDV